MTLVIGRATYEAFSVRGDAPSVEYSAEAKRPVDIVVRAARSRCRVGMVVPEVGLGVGTASGPRIAASSAMKLGPLILATGGGLLRLLLRRLRRAARSTA
jgi:hypothetical protein